MSDPTVTSSGDMGPEKAEDEVVSTSNIDDSESSESSNSNPVSEDSSNSNSTDPTTSSDTSNKAISSSSTSVLRPSVLRPSQFSPERGGASATSSRPTMITPTITVTESDGTASSGSSSNSNAASSTSAPASSFLFRPSKLQQQVKSPVTNAKVEADAPAVSTSEGGAASLGFMPLTKDSNNVNGDGEEKKDGALTGGQNNGGSGAASFLFGEKLEDRANATVNSVQSSQESRKRKLEEEAESAAKIPALEDVEVSTGEEGEVNVIQINCRMYAFDPVKTNWTERVSRGVLRLNDTDENNSRLIVRTQGSLRLMLNTKVFNGMVVERPNDKSVRFTAMDLCQENSNTVVKVFLVMGSHSDMESLFQALQHRLRRFNQT